MYYFFHFCDRLKAEEEKRKQEEVKREKEEEKRRLEEEKRLKKEEEERRKVGINIKLHILCFLKKCAES